MSITVADLIRQKDLKYPIVVSENETVLTALELLAKHNIGCLIVTGPNFSLQGIVSERDCVRKVELKGRRAESTKVSEIMTSHADTIKVTMEAKLEDCLREMKKHNIRHLPVIGDAGETEKVIGLISMKDVIEALLKENSDLVVELQHYVTGSR
jgi:CBS domain-containing protein